MATQLLALVLRTVPLPERLLAVIDDSPTKRYGPKVEGRRHPSQSDARSRGPAVSLWTRLGHAFVGLAASAVGRDGLAAAGLAVRPPADDAPRFHAGAVGSFATKLELAARLVEWIAPLVETSGKNAVDRGRWRLHQGSVLEARLAAGVTIVGRLRKDAALRDLPPKLPPRPESRRGRPRKYGKHKISLAKRAGHKRGWQAIACTVYGQTVTKTYKTFLATYRPAGGVIRVVLVQEDHGWFAFFCTDPDASVQEILEAFADRATIEQDFHDVKEVWGAGQQQVRNIWTNVAVYQLNLWMHTLVELWAWNRTHEELCDRTRLAVGRRRSPPFSRQSPQSPTPTDHEQRIIDDHSQLAAAAKNPRPDPTPHGPGRLTQCGSPKVQNEIGARKSVTVLHRSSSSLKPWIACTM